MFEDYAERLFAHYVGGRWRVPFGTDTLAVPVICGARGGRVVPAGPCDVARAVAARRGAKAPELHRLAAVFDRAGQDLIRALATQSRQMPDPDITARLAEVLTAAPPDGGGILLTTPTTTLPALVGALGSMLRGGVIWCPPPQQAILATLVAQLVQAADLPPGAFALLHARVRATEAALRATHLPEIVV